MIAALAQDGQKEAFVKPIVEGKWNWRAGHERAPARETGCGHMDSFAERKRQRLLDRLLQIFFAPAAGQADFYVVPVRCLTPPKPPTELSLFIIDGKDPNIPTFSPIGKWDGMGLPREIAGHAHSTSRDATWPEYSKIGPRLTCGFLHVVLPTSLPILSGWAFQRVIWALPRRLITLRLST